MSLTDKWINLIYRVATGDWRKRLIIAPLAAACFLSMIIVFIFLSFYADKLIHLPEVFWYPWSLAAGISLIVLGFFLSFISIVCFIKAMGTPVPFCPPIELVTTGPYRFTRNPMLTGLFVQFFGIGIILGSLSLVFFFTPLFIAINVWELKKIEEPELVKRLGQEYMEYRNRTPMFFPFKLKR